MNRPRTTRPEVAAAELGVDANPSPSALAWSVAHAVAIECGRKPDDAMAIASRWATVADIVGEAPPEGEGKPDIKAVIDAAYWDHLRVGVDFGRTPDKTVACVIGVVDGKVNVREISWDDYWLIASERPDPVDVTHALDARPLVPYTVDKAMTERSIKGLETIRAAWCKCGENCRPGFCVNKL